jgi:hypothetical protein
VLEYVPRDRFDDAGESTVFELRAAVYDLAISSNAGAGSINAPALCSFAASSVAGWRRRRRWTHSTCDDDDRLAAFPRSRQQAGRVC